METLDFMAYASEVKEGNINPLEAYIILKAALTDLEKALKEVQDLAIDEANKYGQKSFEAFGAKVEIRNGASRWDYSNVKAHVSLSNQLKYIEGISKIGGGVTSDGEIVEPATKINGKENIFISFK